MGDIPMQAGDAFTAKWRSERLALEYAPRPDPNRLPPVWRARELPWGSARLNALFHSYGCGRLSGVIWDKVGGRWAIALMRTVRRQRYLWPGKRR